MLEVTNQKRIFVKDVDFDKHIIFTDKEILVERVTYNNNPVYSWEKPESVYFDKVFITLQAAINNKLNRGVIVYTSTSVVEVLRHFFGTEN